MRAARPPSTWRSPRSGGRAAAPPFESRTASIAVCHYRELRVGLRCSSPTRAGHPFDGIYPRRVGALTPGHAPAASLLAYVLLPASRDAPSSTPLPPTAPGAVGSQCRRNSCQTIRAHGPARARRASLGRAIRVPPHRHRAARIASRKHLPSRYSPSLRGASTGAPSVMVRVQGKTEVRQPARVRAAVTTCAPSIGGRTARRFGPAGAERRGRTDPFKWVHVATRSETRHS